MIKASLLLACKTCLCFLATSAVAGEGVRLGKKESAHGTKSLALEMDRLAMENDHGEEGAEAV